MDQSQYIRPKADITVDFNQADHEIEVIPVPTVYEEYRPVRSSAEHSENFSPPRERQVQSSLSTR